MRRPKLADPAALEINKYNPALWAIVGREMTEDAVAELHGMLSLEDSILVGHSISFDVRFLRTLFGEFGLKWKAPPQLDTRALARLAWNLPCLKMDTIRKAQGWGMKGAHSAFKDALDAYRIYRAYINAVQTLPPLQKIDDAKA